MCLCMREKEREREGETHSCMLKETQNPVCQDRRACVCMRDDTKRMNGLNHVATPLPDILAAAIEILRESMAAGIVIYARGIIKYNKQLKQQKSRKSGK